MAGRSGSYLHIDSVSWPNNKPCSGVTGLL
jgi:hypothetical protein